MIEYAPIVRAQARRFFWEGADWEDVEQEAWLALCEARPTTYGLAKTVIFRRLRDKLQASLRRPQFAYLEEVKDSHDFLELLEHRESLERMAAVKLSDCERVALRRIVNGEPLLSKREDNARQRVRQKLREAA